MTLNPVSAAHLLPGIAAYDVDTSRLRMRLLARESDGPPGAPAGAGGEADVVGAHASARALLLVHGNASSSLFWQRFMLALPGSARPLAVDLRGFGETEAAPIDATRGLRDHADDVLSLLDALGLDAVDLMGWSMGGGIVARFAADHPRRARTLTLQAPVSPYGFGCTVDAGGRLAFDDAAGTGAGGANPRLVELLAAKDADGSGTREQPEAASPRATVRGFYVAPRAEPWPDEDLWVASVCTTRIGPDFYPGDATTSPNWPGFAPGSRGVLNSMSPRYCRWDDLADLPGDADAGSGSGAPPVLWIRGEVDRIVNEPSALDLATIGQFGLIPGWPGPDVVPPQPMLSQTRAVLERYAAAGGRYRELVLPGVGHGPHLEAQDEVLTALLQHLAVG